MKYTDEQIEALLDFVTDLKGKVSEADDKFNRHEFAEKFAAKLGPYEAKMKALNGEDFDLSNAAYDEYHESYSDLGEEQYVDALVDNIEKTLGHLKEALADGDTAEAAHVAEEAQEQIEEVADKVDDGAHEEVKEEVKSETSDEDNTAASDEELKEDVKEDIHEAEERAEDNGESESKADDKADEIVNEAQDEEQKDEEKDEEEDEEEEFQKLLDEEMKRLEE